jgi:hypothetical protein
VRFGISGSGFGAPLLDVLSYGERSLGVKKHHLHVLSRLFATQVFLSMKGKQKIQKVCVFAREARKIHPS